MKEVMPMSDDRLEALLNDMREESAAEAQVVAAKARVWQKLTATAATLCEEFRPLLPEYLAGRLGDSRRLLIEDHLSRCAGCRRVFAEMKGERKVTALPAARRASPMPHWAKWAVAAGLAAAALYLGRDRIDRGFAPQGPRATVASVNGVLYRVSHGVLHPGATLAEGETVRTGAGSRAVLTLSDGSRVEINERTELVVRAAWSGQTIQLERGDVIVEAAKQRRGYLRVVTDDSTVSVKGTVFAVSTGSSGSLVSVVEGSVAVSQPGSDRLLKRGEQAASSQALSAVPVQSAVSWSENAAKYYAILTELIQIEKQLASTAVLRTQSRLSAYLPAKTIAYVAIPNVGESLQQGIALIERRALEQESEALRAWWTSVSDGRLKAILDGVETVAAKLGDEVVFILAHDPTAPEREIPVVLAEIKSGQQAALKQALDGLTTEIQYRFLGDVLVASDTSAHLTTMAGQLGRGVSTAFAAEIARRYQRGVTWLLGVDVVSVPAVQQDQKELRLLGAKDMKHLFFEQRTVAGIVGNEVSLTFAGPRKGLVSWIGSPAAAGSAEYVSSDTVLAVSAATRNPRQAFDELLSILETHGAKIAGELRKFESETGIDISNDLASALGTDFTVSIERPTLPLPQWFAAVEVVHAALFDSTMRRFVENANRAMTGGANQRQLVIVEEIQNGRTWMTLKVTGEPLTLYWTYDRGYLVMSTERALAAQAIATRAGGFSLVRSSTFRNQLPSASQVHCSGFVWLNTRGALAGLGAMVANPSIKAAIESRDPLLIILNGETERLYAASRTRITSLMLDLLLASSVIRPNGV